MAFVCWTVDEVTEVCLEALATGCIEGVPLEADPEDLALRLGYPDRAVAGADASVDPYGRVFEQRYFARGLAMTRDWGLVTAFYGRDHVYTPWSCEAVTIRAYLLDEPPEWSFVVAELRRHGYEPVFTPDGVPGMDGYTVTVSAVSAKVPTSEGWGTAPGKLNVVTIDRVATPTPGKDQWGPLRSEMRALGKAGTSAWAAWLAQRQATADDYAAVFTALSVLLNDQPARADEWTALRLWFLARAREANVFRPEECTYHWARFGSAPPAEVSRACLAALPMTLDEARSMPESWRDIAPDDARRARMTRALLRLAADAAPDAAATLELHRWRRDQRWLF